MQPGTVEDIAPGVRRLLAPNPSPMTGPGTNTYIIGDAHDLVLVDPGPILPDHIDRILTIPGKQQSFAAIIATHPHLDHSAAAPVIAEKTGAPVLAMGTAGSLRSATMQRLAGKGLSSGGEGVDSAFVPDHLLTDGQTISGDFGDLQVLHTPGHMAEHLSLAFGSILFSGDHAMGWSTSLVSPPDGDMASYYDSLQKLMARDWSLMLPGHGPSVRHVHRRLEELWSHRKMRESQILAALDQASGNCTQLAQWLYTDTPAALLPAAARNILAHLIDLEERNEVCADGWPDQDTVFARKTKLP